MSPERRPPTGAEVRLKGITKRFGDVVANDAVDFHIQPGQIHALLGENGAGKSTLMRVLSGLVEPDEGTVSVDGRAVSLRSPRAALRHGIGMLHQHSVLVPELTVAENVALGRESSLRLRYRRQTIERAVAAMCEEHGVAVDPREPVAGLPVDQVQQVELVRLLWRNVRTIILDEPTAVLGEAYVERLFATLARLRDDGCAVVVITHKLKEVLALADRATVLRRGRVSAVIERADFDERRLAHALVGDELPPAPQRVARRRSAITAFEVDHLSVAGDRGVNALDGVCLGVARGEVLGIAGVEGNGQRELVEALAGVRPILTGTVRVGGVAVGALTPLALDRLGVAVISEDRQRWDIVPELSAAENLLLSRIAAGEGRFARFGLLSRSRMTQAAEGELERFDVRPADPAWRAGGLSGGNQQKLVLARELGRTPAVVVAAHPTRGLDIAAARRVHADLLRLREAGTATLLVSADLDELLALSDRIGVLFRGRMTFAAQTAGLDVARLVEAMMGVGA